MERARFPGSTALRLWACACMAFMIALPAPAAEGLPGATVRPDAAKARDERCKAEPEKCTAEARREQWCKDNPDRCREVQAKMKERQEQCKADPEKCRAQAQAQQEERFKRADANQDGKLTRDEAQKGMPVVARHFDQIDANKDGVVTMEELAAARKARAAQRKDKSA